MKNQIISTLLVRTMLTAAAIPAQAGAPTGNTLDGYPITIHDSTTPAAYALGKDWPITTWYFFDEDGNALGSIPNSAVMEIARTDGTDSVEWEFWLADAFNDYRGVGEIIPMEKGTLHRKVELDADAFAREMLDLANEERIEHGLEPVELDESMMELAMIRAEEASELYSHTRPNGTRVSITYYYAEIINCGARTPEAAVESWMESEGLRDIILTDYYEFGGFGVYQSESGKLYCCGLYRR